MSPHGIMFHHFHSGQHPVGQGSISAGQLADLIHFVGRERILGAKEWTERALRGKLQPGDLCLSFDDTLKCQLDVGLPVLDHFNIHAFWFVYTSIYENDPVHLEIYRYFRTTCFDSVDDFYSAFFKITKRSEWHGEVSDSLENFVPRDYLQQFSLYTDEDRTFRFVRDRILGPVRYHGLLEEMLDEYDFDREDAIKRLWLTENDLRILVERRHVVGLHSHTHPTRLEDLSFGEQRHEYRRNFSAVEAITKISPTAMSHPVNSYNHDTLQVLQDLGIQIGFRANLAQEGFNTKLEFPREDHADIIKRMRAP